MSISILYIKKVHLHGHSPSYNVNAVVYFDAPSPCKNLPIMWTAVQGGGTACVTCHMRTNKSSMSSVLYTLWDVVPLWSIYPPCYLSVYLLSIHMCHITQAAAHTFVQPPRSIHVYGSAVCSTKVILHFAIKRMILRT